MVVPPLVVMLTKSTVLKNYDVSSVEYIYSGGAPLDSVVIDEIKKRYGEISNVVTS